MFSLNWLTDGNFYRIGHILGSLGVGVDRTKLEPVDKYLDELVSRIENIKGKAERGSRLTQADKTYVRAARNELESFVGNSEKLVELKRVLKGAKVSTERVTAREEDERFKKILREAAELEKKVKESLRLIRQETDRIVLEIHKAEIEFLESVEALLEEAAKRYKEQYEFYKRYMELEDRYNRLMEKYGELSRELEELGEKRKESVKGFLAHESTKEYLGKAAKEIGESEEELTGAIERLLLRGIRLSSPLDFFRLVANEIHRGAEGTEKAEREKEVAGKLMYVAQSVATVLDSIGVQIVGMAEMADRIEEKEAVGQEAESVKGEMHEMLGGMNVAGAAGDQAVLEVAARSGQDVEEVLGKVVADADVAIQRSGGDPKSVRAEMDKVSEAYREEAAAAQEAAKEAAAKEAALPPKEPPSYDEVQEADRQAALARGEKPSTQPTLGAAVVAYGAQGAASLQATAPAMTPEERQKMEKELNQDLEKLREDLEEASGDKAEKVRNEIAAKEKELKELTEPKGPGEGQGGPGTAPKT